MYKRRIVLGSIASVTVLASSVLTAGTALAAPTPKILRPISATFSLLIPSNLMSGVPGISALLAASDASSVAKALSNLNGINGATPGLSGMSDATQGLHAVNLAGRGQSGQAMPGSAIGRAATGGTGSTLPADGSVPGLGNTAVAPTSNLGSATSVVPALGGLTGTTPGLSQAAKQLGAGF